MYKPLLYVLLFLALNTIHTAKCYSQTTAPFEMSYFEDVNSTHSFESVTEEKFRDVPNHMVNLGMTKSIVWVKVKLNTKALQQEVVLEIENPFCDQITLSYLSKNNGKVNESLGITYPHSKNKLNHYLPAFVIPTDQLASPVVYFRIKTRWTMLIHITAKTKEDFHKNRVTTYLIAGLYLGGLLLIAIYNLFLYFSTRNFSYVLYVLALLCAILSQGYIYGILIPYLSPDLPEFSFRFPIIIMAATGLFSAWFTIQFLEIKKTSRALYYLLIFAIIFSLFSVGLELLKLDYLSRKVNVIQVLGIAFIIFISAVHSLIKGNKMALFFTIAWSFYLLGIVIYGLKIVGILPHNLFTEHCMHIGTFMEVLLLSFALGHKYSLVRIEKERLEQQTREELELLVKQQTSELEASVEEKEILLKEVHHRVKNNLQVIISLLDLEVASVKDTRNKKVLTQSKSRVYAMSLIHQKLYQSNNLARVNMKSYLEELYSYVQNSYSIIPQKKAPTLALDNKELSLTQAVPLGLIVNELLTNSFKYGINPTGENHIKLSLSFKNDYLELIIADSGLGFDEKEHTYNVKKTLGLFLVKSLTKQLRGTITRFYKKNLFVTQITIPLNNYEK